MCGNTTNFSYIFICFGIINITGGNVLPFFLGYFKLCHNEH